MIVTRGRPIEFLCAVCAGERVRIGPVAGPDKPTYRYPTFEERMRAAAILAAKLLPDLKAQELTGKDGGPIETKEVSALETARRIAFLLRAGLEAQEQGAS